MRRIIGLFLLSLALTFVYCEDKSADPQPRDDAGYYYPRRENYGWRYIQLAGGCTVVHDSFDVKIVARSVRDGRTGFDRLPYYNGVEGQDTVFIYEQGDTLFQKYAHSSVPLLKILVGPVKGGTSWKDDYFDYLISGLESVTLTMNGVTYKNCAKIMKTDPSPHQPNIVYEWWVPGYGKVREIEVDPDDNCLRATELRYFDPEGLFP